MKFSEGKAGRPHLPRSGNDLLRSCVRQDNAYAGSNLGIDRSESRIRRPAHTQCLTGEPAIAGLGNFGVDGVAIGPSGPLRIE